MVRIDVDCNMIGTSWTTALAEPGGTWRSVPKNAMWRGPVQSDTALEGEFKSGNPMVKDIITYLDIFCVQHILACVLGPLHHG